MDLGLKGAARAGHRRQQGDRPALRRDLRRRGRRGRDLRPQRRRGGRRPSRALRDAGATAYGAAVDVADKAALEAWVADAAEALGGIDIVVANVSALAVADDEAAWQAGSRPT